MLFASSSYAQSTVQVQVVQVSDSNGTLAFTPNDITAAPGTMVQFQFHPMNHSVVQSTFDNPCEPISNITPNVTGLFSGFMPVPKTGATSTPVYTVMVNNTTPVWFYCSQGKHCQSGMVGVINKPAANATRNVQNYAALAAQAQSNLSPGQTSSTSSGGTTGTTSSGGSSTSVAVTTGASNSHVAGVREVVMAVAIAGLAAFAL